MIRLFRLRALIALAAMLAYVLPHWALHAGVGSADPFTALTQASFCATPGGVPSDADDPLTPGEPGGKARGTLTCPICGAGPWLAAAAALPLPQINRQFWVVGDSSLHLARPLWAGATARAPPPVGRFLA